MLKIPPPVWALVYVLFAVAISWWLDWPKMPGFPLPPLGIALVTVPWILPVWAIIMFRRADTEINPTSPTNRELITLGPYRFTRNPMYLGLVIVILGIAVWVGAWPMFLGSWLRSLKRKSLVVHIRKPTSESFELTPKREHLLLRLQS
jgi:protein-S-isoprenylcysteine O-methyltransferase Ste14